MNERIFELAKQADIIQWDMLPSGARTPDHESVVKAKKFAELIVRECINRMGEEIVYNDAYKERNKTISDMTELLKEHFGVEE